MPLCWLPTELILQIASYLSQHDLNSLTKANHLLYNLLLAQLYRNDIRSESFLALHHLCRNGHLQALQRLFTTIPSMDVLTQQMWGSKIGRYIKRPWFKEEGHLLRPNPMYEAIENGHVRVVEFLLFQADFRADDRLAWSPAWTPRMGLGIAAVKGDLEMVQLLLSAGADIFHSGHSQPALAQAVEAGQERVAAFLLAEVRRRIYEGTPDAYHNGHGTSAATLQTEDWKHFHLVRNLVKMSVKDYFQLTRRALETAISMQNVRMVELLISEVGPLNYGFGSQPGPVLLTAVSAGNVEVLKLLMSHGADPNLWDERKGDMINPILEAAKMGFTGIVEALVDGGADPNILDEFGRTPLSYAAQHGRVETVELLLGYGVEVTLRDFGRKWRPLDWAVYGQKFDVVNILHSITEGGWW